MDSKSTNSIIQGIENTRGAFSKGGFQGDLLMLFLLLTAGMVTIIYYSVSMHQIRESSSQLHDAIQEKNLDASKLNLEMIRIHERSLKLLNELDINNSNLVEKIAVELSNSDKRFYNFSKKYLESIHLTTGLLINSKAFLESNATQQGTIDLIIQSNITSADYILESLSSTSSNTHSNQREMLVKVLTRIHCCPVNRIVWALKGTVSAGLGAK